MREGTGGEVGENYSSLNRLQRKQHVRDRTAPKKISEVRFGLMSPWEMLRLSSVEVTKKELFEVPSRTPVAGGCLDPRLGVSDKGARCETCKRKLIDCAGHFGTVRLQLPVFHAGFLKHTLTILQCVCKRCSRVIVAGDHTAERDMFLRRMRSRGDALKKAALFKKLVEKCKKTIVCPHCGDRCSTVKKAGANGSLRIIHERLKMRGKVDKEAVGAMKARMWKATEMEPELLGNVERAQEVISPVRALEIFREITAEDCELLWMDPERGRPEDLILTTILVPPVPIRPSVASDVGGSTEDDITIKLFEIVSINMSLDTALQRGVPVDNLMEIWDMLQLQVSQLISGDAPGVPRQFGQNRVIRGFCQRLKGKQGRFRGNLSGKRVDFSARTVISPDPNLSVSEVGVPVHIAKIMTYPERVSRYNIDKLRRAVLNGPNVYPGANFIRPAPMIPTGGAQSMAEKPIHQQVFVRSLTFVDRQVSAHELKFGDVVERHMVDGDIVLFNRQPSLHKMSIMAHRVRVGGTRTFRFNECVCAPYNADFDGDEMNMHLPQTEEARAEAWELMQVTRNLVTPRNGEPLVAATQDFLTASYLLTQKWVFFTREAFCRLVSYLGDANEHIDLPLPAIFKPVPLWTGKQVMSLLVRPSTECNVLVNFELPEKNYSNQDRYMCPRDGYVCFRNSELMCGNLAKKTLGDGSKQGLFYTIIRANGEEEAARCMNRLSKLCARFLGGHQGFSIGAEDVTPSQQLTGFKEKAVATGYEEADKFIELFRQGELQLRPGCDMRQSLESELNGLLGRIREAAGKEAMRTLPWQNAPRIMAECGAKGSALNISQMIACLGQQSVAGTRIPDEFENRSLPHFEPGALHPSAKGFVSNSFFSGLNATEFFFHTMGGREGLVDTAVKTAETGYMARRLMKSLEDLFLHYDRTVRNSEKTVVQFAYGDDGLNPQVMEGDDRPVDFRKLLTHVCASLPDRDARGLHGPAIRALGRRVTRSAAFQRLLPQGEKFHKEVLDFCSDIAAQVDAAMGVVADSDAEDDDADEAKEAKEAKEEQMMPNGGGQNDHHASAQRMDLEDLEDLDKEDDADKNPDGPGSRKWLENFLSLSREERQAWMRDCHTDPSSAAAAECRELYMQNTHRYTRRQLANLFEQALSKYRRAHVEPGEAVGAVGAQSLSEPGTQMTLKTFHFAGVASMNVTLGVPRLKEIINASKQISTPIITARLVQPDSLASARIVQGQIERTRLGQIAHSITEVCASSGASHLLVRLDLDVIKMLHLNITPETAKNSILNGMPGETRPAALRLLSQKDKGNHIEVLDESTLRIELPLPQEKKEKEKDDQKDGQKEKKKDKRALKRHLKLYFIMQALKTALPNVVVAGIGKVNRAVINEEDAPASDAEGGGGGGKRYHILVEGGGLQEVMGAPGIDGRKTVSNHIMEMEQVLGIEAARRVIAEEISYIMSAYGISLDRRHLMLLSDVMTFKGEILGITRFGVAKMRESVLMLASFEKTTDHLFDAAVHSRVDSIVGVSECIIMGVPIPLGTGLFKLMQIANANEEQRRAAAQVLKPSASSRTPLLNKASSLRMPNHQGR